MSQQSAEITHIVNKIGEAFCDIEYPGDDEIAPGGGLEEREIADALRGKDWRDIDAKFLNNCCVGKTGNGEGQA